MFDPEVSLHSWLLWPMVCRSSPHRPASVYPCMILWIYTFRLEFLKNGFAILTQTQFEMMTLATTETSMMMMIIIQRGLCDRVRRVLPSPCMPVQSPTAAAAPSPPPPAASRYMEKLRLLLCPYLAILRAQKNYTDDRFLSSQEQLPQWFDIKCEGAMYKNSNFVSVLPIKIWKNTTKSRML